MVVSVMRGPPRSLAAARFGYKGKITNIKKKDLLQCIISVNQSKTAGVQLSSEPILLSSHSFEDSSTHLKPVAKFSTEVWVK